MFSGGRFSIRRDGQGVRVPDEMLKCVTFIGELANENIEELQGDLLATGFFVAVNRPCLKTLPCRNVSE